VNIRITGMGMIGGFGESITDLNSVLKDKNKKPDFETIDCIDQTLRMPVFKAGTEKLADFFPVRKLRRMDHFSRMALYCCILALEDAESPIASFNGQKTGIILSTGFGAQNSTYKFKDSIFRTEDSGASPTLFSKSVHNTALANITMLLNIKGPGLTISQHGLSFPSALLTAWTWLQNGDIDTVITGCVDEFCEPQGYSKHRWNESPGKELSLRECYHEDHIQGEGSFCMVLSTHEKHTEPYGFLQKIKTGNLNVENPVSEIIPPLIISGHPNRLESWIKKNKLEEHTLNFKNHYGTSPVTPAFDIAVSALTLKSHPKVTTFHVDSDNRYALSVLSR